MNVLIVGNGFDLAHGLPTSYTHFLKFIRILHAWVQYPKDRIGYQRLIAQANFPDGLRQFLENMENNRKTPYGAELLYLMDGNIWIEYFLNKKIPDRGWVGFEGEIAYVIQALDCMQANAANLSALRQLGGMVDILREILGLDLREKFTPADDIPKIVEKLLKDLEQVIRCLEIYLCLCMELPAPSKRLRAVLDIGQIHKVLSFNYTNTFERLYAAPLGMEPEYCYIHGRAREGDSAPLCNMVLGTDEYLDQRERDRKVEFVGFKKYYQRIFKQTDYNYVDWLEYPAFTNVYIVGHSLDVTDQDVLSDILLKENVRTTIFYHSREANSAQIANLVKVLGYQNLNLLTRGKDPDRSIEFLPLPPAEEGLIPVSAGKYLSQG